MKKQLLIGSIIISLGACGESIELPDTPACPVCPNVTLTCPNEIDSPVAPYFFDGDYRSTFTFDNDPYIVEVRVIADGIHTPEVRLEVVIDGERAYKNDMRFQE